MKKTFYLIVTVLFLTGISFQPVRADDFDDLAGLSDPADELLTEDAAPESGNLGGDGDFDLEMAEEEDYDDDESSGLSISFGGYLKTLTYWNEEHYSDELWERYQSMAMFGLPAPEEQKISGFNNVGTRMQLKLEGYLGDHARLFSAFNVNYNLAESLHDSSATRQEEDNTDIRMVESFVEIYEGSRTWKIGSQLVTWGYMEGMEVPTDRLNARDQSYKSTEYEDSKLPAAGILMVQNLGDHQFEVMYIPVSKQDKSPEFSEYLFTGEEEDPENRPNNGKWATRLSGTVGSLDASISYIEGLDTAPDLNASGDGKVYRRVKSPGLDLQFNFGSFLGKLSYAWYLTEDTDGDDPYTKNNWSQYAVGTEFTVGGSTINIYAGQTLIEEFKDDEVSEQTNFLMGQLRERTDFISGHINADFLTGNALNLVLMTAGYWDEDGESVQSVARATLKYKIADGLEVLFSPMYSDFMDNTFTDVQAEVKYSF